MNHIHGADLRSLAEIVPQSSLVIASLKRPRRIFASREDTLVPSRSKRFAMDAASVATLGLSGSRGIIGRHKSVRMSRNVTGARFQFLHSGERGPAPRY